MTDLPTCLTAFAVAALADPLTAKPMIVDAIDTFVRSGPAEPEAAAVRLRKLADAYADLKLDGSVALVTTEAIERRISLLVDGAPSGCGAPSKSE